MPHGIDPEWLGQRLRQIRKDRGLTLRQVSEQTGISTATLSRIERGAVRGLESDTLLMLSEWMGTEVEQLKAEPPPIKQGDKTLDYTRDIVELHLRADKRLDKKTAAALANLFRTVYKQLTEKLQKE